MGNPYNGYQWPERMAKFKEQQRRIEAKALDEPRGPCRLCCDPGGEGTGVVFEYHDEDYSLDYSWAEPAAYVVCRDCHIHRIHQRFRYPISWNLFLAHVGRGGFAREMRLPEVQKELATYRLALDRAGPLPALPSRNAGHRNIGGAWFARLTCDLNRMSDRTQRPRP